ncbi:MAG: FAD-binding oxidoreductase [Myxococcota bacterium]
MPARDFAVIGAGIAGASAAFELQAHGSVVLLEREPLPGHHTTGRSAAFLVHTYGNAVVRKLTRGARSFLEAPPQGFASTPLVEPRPVLWIAREDQHASIGAALSTARRSGSDLHALGPAEALEVCPVLREDYVASAALEPGALHIDVAGLLDAFLRGFRARGGEVATRSEVTRIDPVGGGFVVETRRGIHRVAVVVNAAGAWCDEVAKLADVLPLGLLPLRRTAITFTPPPGADIHKWPCIIDADEEFYLKPEGGQLLASPCDETPSPPCDATADDYEVALAVDRVQRATTLAFRHIQRRWAGLRTFAPDRSPVIGMDPGRPGFLWLAGQGGFGIMTAPAAARAAASLIVHGKLPPDLTALGLDPAHLSPARLQRG